MHDLGFQNPSSIGAVQQGTLANRFGQLLQGAQEVVSIYGQVKAIDAGVNNNGDLEEILPSQNIPLGSFSSSLFPEVGQVNANLSSNTLILFGGGIVALLAGAYVYKKL